MNLEEINRIFKLLKQCDWTPMVKVSEIAKEGGWKRTDLMEFINMNKGHFELKTMKEKSGLFVAEYYDDVSDKKGTPEWVAKMTETYKNTLYIKHGTSFGSFYSIDETFELIADDDDLMKKWRNTPEKVNKALGQISEHKKELNGNLTDKSFYTHYKCDLEILERNGWELVLEG